MEAVEEWVARITELAKDCELEKDPKKCHKALQTCHDEGRRFLMSEFQAGRLHPELGVWIHMLVEVDPEYLRSLVSAARQQGAKLPKTHSVKPSKTHYAKKRRKTGWLSRQLPTPQFFGTGRAYVSLEDRFVWTVHRVLRGLQDLDESQRKSIRTQAEALRDSYRKVLIGTPKLGVFLTAVDRSDIAELERLWPDAEKELVWAVSEKHKAKDNPIGARLSRLVHATIESVGPHQIPAMEKGTFEDEGTAPSAGGTKDRSGATAPGSKGVLTKLQHDIYVEVEKEPMTVKALAGRLYKSEDAVKKAIRVLKERGMLANKPGRGYYRIDKPPAL